MIPRHGDMNFFVYLCCICCIVFWSMLAIKLQSLSILIHIVVNSVKQTSMDAKMRSSTFAAYGALSDFAVGSQHQAFLEQVKTASKC